MIWEWFGDQWQIGVGGFKMLSDSELIFAKYPTLYSLKKGEKPIPYLNFQFDLKKMRPLVNNQILLWSDDKVWLTNNEEAIIKQWQNLTEEVNNAPMDRNFIYDMDYANGNLLVAYWGKRTFELIGPNQKRKILKQCTSNWLPHWVAFLNGNPLLFSSNMDFEQQFSSDGKRTTIKPEFVQLAKGTQEMIWNITVLRKLDKNKAHDSISPM